MKESRESLDVKVVEYKNSKKYEEGRRQEAIDGWFVESTTLDRKDPSRGACCLLGIPYILFHVMRPKRYKVTYTKSTTAG